MAVDPVTGDPWCTAYDRSLDSRTIMIARRSGET
jgi:hypothetical protein